MQHVAVEQAHVALARATPQLALTSTLSQQQQSTMADSQRRTQDHRTATTRRTWVSSELRERAIDLIDARQWQVKDVVEALGINRNTLYSIVRKYRASGRTVCARPRGRAPLLSAALKEELCSWVDGDCTQTLDQLSARLRNERGVSASRSTVLRALNDFHFSFKRTTPLPDRRNCPATIERRRAYALDFVRLLPQRKKLVFVDEVGFSCSLRARYGWSAAGSRAQVPVTAVRSQNYSVAAAMTAAGLLHYRATKGAYNTELFMSFIDELVTALAAEHVDGAIVVMDNVAFHKATVIRNSLAAFGHSVVFLPPYSPFLNPIEEFFAKWKHHVRRGAPRNERELYRAIESSSELVTEQDCAKYFEHMEQFISPCLAGECIVG